MSATQDQKWLSSVQAEIKKFSRLFGIVYRSTKRERSASFEIGCFHMLLNNYSGIMDLVPNNLTKENEFRYLTTPSGNPSNFSWVQAISRADNQIYQIRQQVRIQSHWGKDIAFCPDLIVLKPDSEITDLKDPDYANGKRSFYTIDSSQVIAAHECKSLSPFPELLVSFIGMFEAAHAWFGVGENMRDMNYTHDDGEHLAPCLFVGGDARPIQRRMIEALEKAFPINIVTGLHWSQFKLERGSGKAKYLAMSSTQKYESPF